LRNTAFRLIQVKDDSLRTGIIPPSQRRLLMPVDSMLVAASVVLMFVVFAAVLAWGDAQTRTRQLAQQPNAKRRSF
jgi:hypothetical protein